MTPHSLQQIDLGTITISSTNTVRLVPFAPIRLLQFGCIITTAATADVTVMTATLEKATGAALAPATGSFGFTMTIPILAINLGVYIDVSAVSGRRILYPGESIELTSDGGSTAGAARFYAIVDMVGMNDADLRNSVVGHPGSTTNATSLAALTKVTA